MKILISGFEPFGGHSINPTQQLIEDFKTDAIPGAEIRTVLLPVRFDECVELLIKEIQAFMPDALISCGLASGRLAITPERIAINIKDIAPDAIYLDNNGARPEAQSINPDGPDGLFTTLPIRKMVDRMKAAGIPSSISNTAGTFICNNTMYGVLDYIRNNNRSILAGFVHFPASTEMATGNPELPSISQQHMLEALRIVVQTTVDELQASQ
jgi:pyroglutamyl-peptidase